MAYFVCPDCSSWHVAPDEYVGRNSQCPKCQREALIRAEPPTAGTRLPDTIPPRAKKSRATAVAAGYAKDALVVSVLAAVVTFGIAAVTSARMKDFTPLAIWLAGCFLVGLAVRFSVVVVRLLEKLLQTNRDILKQEATLAEMSDSES